MKLTIFGANGPVGVLLTKRALDQGHTVTAVTRRPEQFPLTSPLLTVQSGDVFNAQDVARAVEGHDAVLSTFGVPYTRKPVTVYSRGIINILDAMKHAGVRRLVAVTSGGTNPKLDLREGIFWSIVLKSIVGRTLYVDMRRMEDLVIASDVDWTIVRPAELVDAPNVTNYRVEETYVIRGMSKTSRLDLADFMLKQASASDLARKAVAIASSV